MGYMDPPEFPKPPESPGPLEACKFVLAAILIVQHDPRGLTDTEWSDFMDSGVVDVLKAVITQADGEER